MKEDPIVELAKKTGRLCGRFVVSPPSTKACNMMNGHLLKRLNLAALAVPLLASGLVGSSAANAQSDGISNFAMDRTSEYLVDQAQAAGMTVCEGVLMPLGTDGTYRLIFRLVRPGEAVIPRPANSMPAIIMTDNCPR
jgi:hypothetical protein